MTRSRQKHKSFRNKLILLLVLAAVIPTLAIGVASYCIINHRLTQLSIASAEAMTQQQIDVVNELNDALESSLADLTDSSDTRGFLQLRDEPETQSYYIDLIRLTEKINTLLIHRNDAVTDVAILWNDGSLPVVRSRGSQLDLSGDYREKFPFSSLDQSDTAQHWICLKDLDGQYKIILYKTLFDSMSGSPVGEAVILMNSGYVSASLNDNRNAVYSQLLDQNGNVIVSSPKIENEKTLTESSISQMALSNTGSTILNGSQERYLLSSAQVENGFRIVHLYSMNNITRSRNQVLASIVASIVLALAVAALFSTILFRYLNDPIQKLKAGMADFEQGNFGAHVDIKRDDEFGQLGDVFNEMGDDIQRLIQENEKQEKLKQSTEMKFLQAQITPHFLYNTLNSIKVLARMKKNDEAVKMTTSLISLLRLASQTSEKLTLVQEITYTEDYVELMRLRRGSAIELSSNIPEKLRKSEILKFTIQPFVENSIIHNTPGKDLKIWIYASLIQDSTVQLIIQDNGPGFDTAKIEIRKLHSKSHFSSIGIRNVEERIKLYYGDAYGVQISSTPGTGTVVIVTYPLILMQQEEDQLS